MKKRAHWLAILLLLLFFWRLQAMALASAPTMDEVLHTFHGVAYWRVSPAEMVHNITNNPPAVNALIGLGANLFAPAAELPEPAVWQTGDAVYISQVFMWETNEHGLAIIWAGRTAVMLLAVGLGALLYRWGRRLLRGNAAALLILFVYSFDPNLLAHSALATIDLGTAFFLLLVAYLIWRYWQQPSKRLYGVAGVALGLALAAKFSTLVLLPFLVLMAVYRQLTRPRTQAQWLRAALELLGWFVLGGITFLAAYRFDLVMLQKDFVWQQAHQLVGHPGFLMGEISTSGWWYYFPVVFALKTPLATLVLLLLGLGAMVYGLWRKAVAQAANAQTGQAGQKMWFTVQSFLDWRVWWPMGVAVTLAVASMLTRVNIGYRYLLPALPLLYLGVGYLVGARGRNPRFLRPVLGVALITLAVESLAIHPDYLAYFNPLAGGPRQGWHYVVDSNIDWGQDMQALGEYVAERDIASVHALWLAIVPPELYGITAEPLYDAAALREYNDLYTPFYPPRPAAGVYVLSVSHLQGVFGPDLDYLRWFREREPTDRVGYSLFVYEVAAAGQPASLALSGIGMSHLALPDFEQAFGTSNQVRPRWYDARRSLLWPGGTGETVWAAVGEGHWPEHPALQALYPAEPVLRGESQDREEQVWRYGLYQWAEGSPVAAALQGQLPALVGTPFTDLGWSEAEVVGSSQWETQRQPLPGPALFGEMWQLLGYTVLGEGPLQAGQPLELLSYWQVAAESSGSYKIFVHLLDETGQIVAQNDALDVRVEGLQPGDQLAQLHTLFLPPELPPGRYALQMGLYESETFARFTVPVGVDRTVDRVLLHSFEIR